MQQDYEASTETLERDILRLVGKLGAKGLVSMSSSEEWQHSHV